MANLNNEGFTITPDSECVGGSKPVFWADDGNTGGHALRAGTIPCTPRRRRSGAPAGRPPPPSRATSTATASATSRSARQARTTARGAVHVLYGSATGVTHDGLAVLVAELGRDRRRRRGRRRFGRSLAVGNFNGDGFADLAIGAPGENGGARHGPRPLRQRERPDRDGKPAVDAGLDRGRRQRRGRRPFRRDARRRQPRQLHRGERAGDRRARRGHRGRDGRRHRPCPEGHARPGSRARARRPGARTPRASPTMPRPATASAPRSPSATSAARRPPTSRSACPRRTGAATVDYGVVHVLLGSATGLTATGSSLWSQNSTGVGDTAGGGRRLRRLARDRQCRRQRRRRPDRRRAGRGHRRGRERRHRPDDPGRRRRPDGHRQPDLLAGHRRDRRRRRRRATSSATPWRSATSAATASSTSRSGRRARAARARTTASST